MVPAEPLAERGNVETKDVLTLLISFAAAIATVIFGIGNERARTTARFDALAKETEERAEAMAEDARARDAAIGKDMQAEVAGLHGRINDVRENYVRRDDFFEALRRVEQGQRDIQGEVSRLRHEQRSTGTTIAAIAAKLNVDDIAARSRPQGED